MTDAMQMADELHAEMIAQPAPTGNAPEPVAWLVFREGCSSEVFQYEHDAKRHRDNINGRIEPLYAAPASNPQEAVRDLHLELYFSLAKCIASAPEKYRADLCRYFRINPKDAGLVSSTYEV